MARVAKDYGYTLAELRKLTDDDAMSTALRVEFFFDDEAQSWHFRVPALHINGGGARGRDQAEAEAMEAIAFALQGDPRDYDGEAEVTTFDVSVVPPAA